MSNYAVGKFPHNNWSAYWYGWLTLTEFVGSSWKSIDISQWLPTDPKVIQQEIDYLVRAAEDERADALDEIISQSDEFISYFLNLMTAAPSGYPATTRVLNIASLVAAFVELHFKGVFERPRPSQLCPALAPPIAVPGHASFPSGHATQSHLMALCMGDVFKGLPQEDTMRADLTTLAHRIARNREIAGLHYPSDSKAGMHLAAAIHTLLQSPGQARYANTVSAARQEWQ